MRTGIPYTRATMIWRLKKSLKVMAQRELLDAVGSYGVPGSDRQSVPGKAKRTERPRREIFASFGLRFFATWRETQRFGFRAKPRRNERRKARSQSLLRPSRLLPFDFEQRHGLLSILDADGFAGRKCVPRTRGLGGCFADQDLAANRIRFQTRSRVHSVSDRGVLGTSLRPDVADGDFARVQPDSDSDFGKA